MTKKTAAATISIISNTSLVVMKFIAGILSGSVSVISEAIHSMMDLLAAVIAFFAVRISDNPADEEHPYGHGKFENVSGVIEALLIFNRGYLDYIRSHTQAFDKGPDRKCQV